jgi:hypothetical protein
MRDEWGFKIQASAEITREPVLVQHVRKLIMGVQNNGTFSLPFPSRALWQVARACSIFSKVISVFITKTPIYDLRRKTFKIRWIGIWVYYCHVSIAAFLYKL